MKKGGYLTIGVLLFLLAWQVACVLVNSSLLSSPVEVYRSASSSLFSVRLWEDLMHTLLRSTSGLVLAVVIGVPIGLLIGSFNVLRMIFEPLIDWLRSIPVSALYPVFVLFLGVGDLSKVGMVTVACATIMAVHALHGVLRTPVVRRDMALMYGANKWQEIVKVNFPSSIPSVTVGVKISASLSILVAILCEMFMGANKGLGQSIIESYTTFNMPKMYFYIIISGVFGVLLNLLIGFILNLYFPWTTEKKY